MHANTREECKEALPAILSPSRLLRITTTGDTLCDPAQPVILERMEFPDPVIEVAVEPKDQSRPGENGRRAAASGRRRSFVPRTSTMRVGQTVIKGWASLHLDILVDRMKREFKVEANVGAPQVAYRETITQLTS